jgi:cytosine deaminase
MTDLTDIAVRDTAVTDAAGTRLVLRGGRLADGAVADVVIDTETGIIAAVGQQLAHRPGDVDEDCRAMMVLPAPAEPHAHLDKALSADRAGWDCPNPGGDLAGAIAAWHAQWPLLTHEDLVDRATRAVEQLVLHGTTAIRSHVDVGDVIGTRAIRALVEVKARVEASGLADLQLVALVAPPISGAGESSSRRLLEEALAAGADLVGGCPYRHDDPWAAVRTALDIAEDHGVGVDLHTDETIDASVLTVVDLARAAAMRGVGAGITASHCVSLGVQEEGVQADVARQLADAGVSVVALPQTNLYLQARGHSSRQPRGITALRALLDAGVNVAAGADNIRDPFCTVGRMDATETAALLIMAGHLDAGEAWSLCSAGARRAMGLAPVTVAAGQPAELVCIEGQSLCGAVAAGSEQRLTIHRGRIVARSTVSRVLGAVRDPAPVPV